MDIDVSIIMPVYNSDKYVKKAAMSVLDQSYKNIELIMIDDGSKDKSPQICDELAKADIRVVVIHKKNEGICKARNTGISIAKGKYIGFCDNDDYYKPKLIEDNIKIALENNLDIIRYSKEKVIIRKDNKRRIVPSKIEDMIIEKKDFYKHYQNIRREDTVWSAFYKKSIIDEFHIRFNEKFKYGGEDACFNLDVLKHCNILGFNSKSYYCWMQRDEHSTSKSFHKEFIDMYNICIEKENDFIQNICGNKVDKAEKIIFINNTYLYLLASYMFTDKCPYSLKQKSDVFKNIRNMPLFCDSYDKETKQKIKAFSKRIYITSWLFYHNHFKIFVAMLEAGEKILAKKRYRKE